MFIEEHALIPCSIHSSCNWPQESESAMDSYHGVFLHGHVNRPRFPGLEHFVNLPVVVDHDVPTGFAHRYARRVNDPGSTGGW